MVQAVLFDADGVLVDACDLHYVAFNRALATKGWKIGYDEHMTIYNGLPTKKKLERLTRANGFPQEWHEDIHVLKQQFTIDAIDECLRPDLTKRRLLLELMSFGIAIGVCSNSLQCTLERMLRAIGVDDLCECIVGNDRVVNPKPAPDIYFLGAQELDIPIQECVIVEDSPVGLTAARAANPLDIVFVQGPDEVNATLLPRILGHSILSAAA